MKTHLNNHTLMTVKDQSLGDVIQQQIEDWIFSGELNSGDRINEKRLSEQLGVSRAPIREATRALQQLGLVEVINNRGVFVRSVNLKQVIDIFNIRVCLAELAASEAARRVTSAGVDALAALVAQMDAAKDADAYLPLNLAFHRQIFRMADNERLALLDEALGKELRLFRLRGLRAGGGMHVSNAEHKEILTSFRERNAEQAGRLFQHHVLAGRDRFLATIDKQEPPVPRARRRAAAAAP